MSKIDSKLTAGRLRELLHYNPETGMFTRLHDARRWKAGQLVGSINMVNGYTYITIDGHADTAHRFAWLYMTDEWPNGVIDHIDGIRDNNRFTNLRDVPHAVNIENRKRAQTDNKTGFLGVSMRRGRYRATLNIRSKQLHIGDFDTPELAHAAYLEAKRLHHVGNTL